ncbi:unnamed protein product [Nippostrongylus brasiliensis]|uniref:Ground-like domain-containing protein n=1 Tax=Nippostrongylus brasiliensis TaxID=27835 RepID=A0A158R1L7_NIPBR|nr:unnamed protein product [Nippostrongylus brasiliensis]
MSLPLWFNRPNGFRGVTAGFLVSNSLNLLDVFPASVMAFAIIVRLFTVMHTALLVLANSAGESIGNDAEQSKLAIVRRAEAEIGGRFDVICASGVFSYYAVARLFCEVKIGSVSCLAFRHDAIGEELSRKSPEVKVSSAEGTWKDDGNDRRPASISVVNVEGDVKLLRRKGRMSDQRAVPANPTNMDPISTEQEIDDEDQSWSSVRMRRPWRIPAHEYTAEEAKVHALREETLAELDELERRERELEVLGKI